MHKLTRLIALERRVIAWQKFIILPNSTAFRSFSHLLALRLCCDLPKRSASDFCSTSWRICHLFSSSCFLRMTLAARALPAAPCTQRAPTNILISRSEEGMRDNSYPVCHPKKHSRSLNAIQGSHCSRFGAACSALGQHLTGHPFRLAPAVVLAWQTSCVPVCSQAVSVLTLGC